MLGIPLLIWGRNRVTSIAWELFGLNVVMLALVVNARLTHPVLTIALGLLFLAGGYFAWPRKL